MCQHPPRTACPKAEHDLRAKGEMGLRSNEEEDDAPQAVRAALVARPGGGRRERRVDPEAGQEDYNLGEECGRGMEIGRAHV